MPDFLAHYLLYIGYIYWPYSIINGFRELEVKQKNDYIILLVWGFLGYSPKFFY